MKKTLSVILITLLLVTVFTACGDKYSSPDPAKNNMEGKTTTAAPETTTEEATTEEEKTTEKETEKKTTEKTTKGEGTEEATEITGVFIPLGQDEYGITEENLNKITFKNGKAYVQMNFLDVVAEFKVNYTLNEEKGTIILGAGKAQNGTVIFKKGVTLTPDEYWQNLTIKGMEKCLVLEGYSCPEFYLDGTVFSRNDQ